MGHLASYNAPLCCDKIVQYNTLRFCAQSLLYTKKTLDAKAPASSSFGMKITFEKRFDFKLF